MAATQRQDPQYLDEHHQRISEFAAEYFDDDDERDAFVGELMTRRGYTARTRTDWEPPAETKSGSNGGGGQAGQPRKPSYFKQR